MPIIDSLPIQHQTEYTILQKVRTVYDITTFSFRNYLEESASKWVVMNIVPDKDSGSGTIPGGHINLETGEVVVPPNSSMVIIKKGTWKLLSAYQPNYPESGIYDWTEPFEQSKRKLEVEDVYSAFSYGGVIVFQPNPNGTGLEQFHYTRLIFSQWQESVALALTSSAQIKNMLDGEAIKSEGETLSTIINQSNPFLSALALRESLRLQLIFPQSCSKLLYGRENDLIAVFENLMITASSTDQRNQWLNELMTLIKNSNDLQYLKSLGFGAFSTVIFMSQYKATSNEGITILNSIHERLKIMKVDTKQAPELYYMFDKSGIH